MVLNVIVGWGFSAAFISFDCWPWLRILEFGRLPTLHIIAFFRWSFATCWWGKDSAAAALSSSQGGCKTGVPTAGSLGLGQCLGLRAGGSLRPDWHLNWCCRSVYRVNFHLPSYHRIWSGKKGIVYLSNELCFNLSSGSWQGPWNATHFLCGRCILGEAWTSSLQSSKVLGAGKPQETPTFRLYFSFLTGLHDCTDCCASHTFLQLHGTNYQKLFRSATCTFSNSRCLLKFSVS